MKRISVIGVDADLPDEVRAMAERVGADIASSGCVLICGGRGGVMEAACKGAKDKGGVTVGILPSSDGSDANPFVDVVIPTGLGYMRNSLVVSSADAVIAVNGSTGTLSEICMALNYGKPVVAVKGSGGVSDTVKDAFPGDRRIQRIVVASAEDAASKALEL